MTDSIAGVRSEVQVQVEARPRPAVRVFGPLAIETDDRVLGPRDLGGTRPKRVLEILLAARGHPVPTDRLAELLWAQELPQNAAGSLQTFVSVLRRRLVCDRDWARELVVTEAEAYRFDTGLVDLDLDRFDSLTERARRAPTHDARRLLEEAIALVRGEVLEDEPYAVWAQELRAAYQGRILGARLDAADAALAALDYSAALAHAEAAAELDRYGERAQRALMLALYALGRQHEALNVYRRFRARLDEELGLAPSTEARALESAILRQDEIASLLPRRVQPARRTTSRTSLRLLGRTGELDTLEHAVRRALDGSFALLLVEGEAGIGKSRLLDELAVRLSDLRFGRGGASELEQHLPYVPLAAALRQALGRPAFDGRRRRALVSILPELALDDPTDAFGQLEALEALAEVIAEHAPLVLFLDDVQWADAATLAALSYLRRRSAGLPLAVVVAARSDELTADHPVRLLRPDEVVRLEPLTRAEMAPLSMPDLYESTGGNPRLIVGAIERGDGVPDSTLANWLLARCRAEGPWPYRVLLAASVIGERFEPDALAELLYADAGELTEELERLCERGILAVDGFGFRFRYRLTHDALCSSLSPARRRLLEERLQQSGDGSNGSRIVRRAAPRTSLSRRSELAQVEA